MEIEQTGEFEKDVKRSDRALKQRLNETIHKILENPRIGKPLEHLHFVFSIRILNKRLIYQFKDNKILLVCFKSREEVYDYLRTRL